MSAPTRKKRRRNAPPNEFVQGLSNSIARNTNFEIPQGILWLFPPPPRSHPGNGFYRGARVTAGKVLPAATHHASSIEPLFQHQPHLIDKLIFGHRLRHQSLQEPGLSVGSANYWQTKGAFMFASMHSWFELHPLYSHNSNTQSQLSASRVGTVLPLTQSLTIVHVGRHDLMLSPGMNSHA